MRIRNTGYMSWCSLLLSCWGRLFQGNLVGVKIFRKNDLKICGKKPSKIAKNRSNFEKRVQKSSLTNVLKWTRIFVGITFVFGYFRGVFFEFWNHFLEIFWHKLHCLFLTKFRLSACQEMEIPECRNTGEKVSPASLVLSLVRVASPASAFRHLLQSGTADHGLFR
jgi:hypothetical protein